MPTHSLHYPDTTATHHRLPNGLDIIIKEDQHAEVASLQAWCGAGSIHENQWLGAGLSHILEHMLFKGTSKRKGPEIATQVQDVGGYINAYTSFDRTVYWIDAPSSGASACLDVLLDVMTDATLPEDEYEKEQEVIRREFAMGFDDPDRMSAQLLFATAFQQHPYKHPVIGHLDIFNQLERADVLAYYKQHYVPNNMLFVVVGNVDCSAVIDQISAHFEHIPRQAYAPVPIATEPVQLGRRDAHREFETQLTKMHLCWHIPDVTHPDMPALDVLAGTLGQGRSSRLYRRIREELQLAHSIGAYAYTPAHGGIFSVSATAEPENREAIEEAVFQIIETLADEGLRPDELEKAKKSCLVDTLGELTTMRGQANDLATNWMLTRNLNFTRDYLQAIHSVSNESIKAVVARYLRPANLTAVSLNPKGSQNQAPSASVRSQDSGTRSTTLNNGLKLLLHPDHRVPLVAFRASFYGGLLLESADTSGLTQLASRCLLKGTNQRNAAQVAETIEGVGGSIGSTAGNNTFAVSAESLEADLPLALDLLSEVVQQPAFPDSEIEREKTVQLASIKSESDHLVSLAVRKLRTHLFAGHPYAHVRVGSEDSVASLTAAQAQSFHQAHAVGANGVLAIYGAFDPGEVEERVQAAFGSLPKGQRAFSEICSPPTFAQSEEFDIETDKQQAVLVRGFRGLPVESPDRLAMEVVEEACSDMSSRLFMRIREEMGLAYYVSASQMIGLASGAFYFYLGTDPQKLGDVERALDEEIRKLAEHGLTTEEFDRAKATMLGKAKMETQSLGARAAVESLDELYGFGHDHHRSLRERLETLSLDEIQRVLRTYLHEKASVTVRVAPS